MAEIKARRYNVNPLYQMMDDAFFFGFNPDPIQLTIEDYEKMLGECGGDHVLLKNHLMYNASNVVAHELLGYGRSLDGKVEIPSAE